MAKWRQVGTSWPTHVWEPDTNAKAVIVELPHGCSWHIWVDEELCTVRSGCESLDLAKAEVKEAWKRIGEEDELA